MKKKSNKHHAGRIVSLFLVLCMVLSMAPVTVFADTNQEITLVDFGKVFKGLDPAHPVAFTTELNPNSDCPNQMTIFSEGWFADGQGMIDSSNPTKPMKGTEYKYVIALKSKPGYAFPCDSDGNYSGKVICDSQTIYNGSPVEAGVYALVTNQQDGSQIITIGGYPVVTATDGTVQDDYVINNANNNSEKSPQTGDNSNMMLWLVILIASGAGVLGTKIYGRKKKYSVK